MSAIPPRVDDTEVIGRCELESCGKAITRRMAMEPGASAHYCSWAHAHEVRTSGVHGALLPPTDAPEGGSK